MVVLPDPGVAVWQERIMPVWKRVGGGCHLNRKIDDLITAAGFRIVELKTCYPPGPRSMTYTYQDSRREMLLVPRFSAFGIWFRPKGFESERLYERLGALVIKRYVPTGGDLDMRRLRRHHPGRRWVTSSLQSLCTYREKDRSE